MCLLVRCAINLTSFQHAAFKLRQETAKFVEEDNDMITAARKIAQKFQQMAKYTKYVNEDKSQDKEKGRARERERERER